MKKIVSIFLLLVMLIHLVGYKGIFMMQHSAAIQSLDKKIDAGIYNNEDLIELQMPLQMPYYSDKEFEPAYGEVEYNGVHYQYVKRKIQNNTLYLLCLPNFERVSLDKNQQSFEKNLVNGKTDSKHTQISSNTIFSDYTKPENQNVHFNVSNDKLIHFSFLHLLFKSQYRESVAQPPEFLV